MVASGGGVSLRCLQLAGIETVRGTAGRGGVKHRSSFGAPSLGELTPSAERHSLSLALEPEATHAPTDLADGS